MGTFAIICGIGVFLIVIYLLYRLYLQLRTKRISKKMMSAGGMSMVEKVTLGWLGQYILIQAEDIRKPVLLVLHGGPGIPMPGVGCRGVDWVFNLTTSELIRHFTVVYWDQRGTGKSYSPNVPKLSIRLEQFVTDANELTDYLRTKFNQDKIYLAGASWGSIIGIQLAHFYPDKFHAYFGISQIVNWSKSDKLAYEWLQTHASTIGNNKAIKELTDIGYPPYIKDVSSWNCLRKWLFTFGGYIYKDDHVRHPGISYLVKTLLKSPDYTYTDIYNTFTRGMALSYSLRLLEDISKFDALSQIRKLEVPICLFHGKHDRAVSGELVSEFYEQVETPTSKKLVWLEDSAHIFSLSDSRTVEKLMIQMKHEMNGLEQP